MAKFLPARLFRRFSTLHDNDNDSSNSINDDSLDASVLCSDASPPHKHNHPHLHRRPSAFRSWSRSKLRPRSPTHTSADALPTPPRAARDCASSVSSSSPPYTLPPSISATDTSRLVDGPICPRNDSLLRRRRRPLSAALEGTTPIQSVEELQLHAKAETPEQPPIVALQHPSPTLSEEEEANESEARLRATGRTISRQSTLASLSSAEQNTAFEDCSSFAQAVDAQLVDPPFQFPVRSSSLVQRGSSDASTPPPPPPAAMPARKIWVKRPGASPTMVSIKEDDLVDDVRDLILHKYRNTLGKTIDAPDMTLIIVSRAAAGSTQRSERTLGPEENMINTIEGNYPDGQTVEDALIVNVPHKRSTPRPSPRVNHYSSYQAIEDYRPMENGTDYFPPMPAFIPSTMPQTASSHDSRGSHHHHSVPNLPASEHMTKSMSVLNSGQVPPLPSPSALGARWHPNRPKFPRQATSSPTTMSHILPATSAAAVAPTLNSQTPSGHRHSVRPRLDSAAADGFHSMNAAAPPLPTPPAPEAAPTNRNSSTPPPLSATLAVHPHRPPRPRKTRKPTPDKQGKARLQADGAPGLVNTVLDGSVPPISVLIVEDNIINMRILEGLMKRLKVRWQTAANGKIAVDKWRLGGFHLVLMDIQMPVMTGLEATKEIRRLERVNGIGVFSSSAPTSPDEHSSLTRDNNSTNPSDSPSKSHNSHDRLPTAEGLFKSPVIIVALTASSLQSDRHEALAVGCNDFLTKPVDSGWLERKVKEWGCMQALIDFDGWRRWREQAAIEDASKTPEQRKKDREKEEKDRIRAEKMAKLHERQAQKSKEEKERKKRVSLGGAAEFGNAAPAREGSREPSGASGVSNGGANASSGVSNGGVGMNSGGAPTEVAT